MQDSHNAIVTPIDPPICAQTCGSLGGLTFVVKDLFDVRGLPTYAGNPEYAVYRGIPGRNAAAVDVLLESGASLIAKTHLHELAYGITGINPHFGTPVNPVDPDRIPGGSSSGSAVAVAAGIAPFALGSDTAGSIRVPAGFCGICSLRPTFDRISLDGCVPLSPSMDTVGVFACHLDMLRKVATVMLKEDSVDCGRLKFKRALIPDEISGWDERLIRIFEDVLGATEALGARQEKFDHGLLYQSLEAQRVVQFAEILGVHEHWLKSASPKLGEDVKLHIDTAANLSVPEVGRAVSRKAQFAARFIRLLGHDGIFILPVAAGPAPLLSELSDLESSIKFRMQTLALNTVASVAGLPAVTIPVRTPDGLSVGIQIVGKPYSDIGLISLATELTSRIGAS